MKTSSIRELDITELHQVSGGVDEPQDILISPAPNPASRGLTIPSWVIQFFGAQSPVALRITSMINEVNKIFFNQQYPIVISPAPVSK